jgi:predicted SnoaL-like aldol condensation-catalyzing enzyme
VVLTALQVIFSEHRIGQVDQFFAEDFIQHSPYALPGGREGLKRWWASVVYAIPDVSTTCPPDGHQVHRVVTFRTVQGTIAHDPTWLTILGSGPA